jgi:hypothetical protein
MEESKHNSSWTPPILPKPSSGTFGGLYYGGCPIYPPGEYHYGDRRGNCIEMSAS